MKKRKRMTLLVAGLIAALMLPMAAQALSNEGNAAVSEQEGCAVTSIVSGQLSIHGSKDKTNYYSGWVEANETFFISGLNIGQQYKVIVDANEGSTYFGALETAIQDGQLTGTLQLDEFGKLPTDRSVMSIQYEVESNNSIKKANALSEDTIYGRIEKKLLTVDVDYFKITIPDNGDYAFVLDNIPEGKDYDLSLYNSKSERIASSATTADMEIIKIKSAKAGEVYYCRVEGYKKASDNGNSYRLQYAPVFSLADDHGNNTAQATEIELTEIETMLDGKIDYPKDIDFFAFTARTNGIHAIYTTGNIDSVGCVYDSAGTLLAENDNGVNWNFSLEIALLAAERYFVAVKHSGIGTGTYALYIEQPENLPFTEQNAGNSLDTATSIVQDGSGFGWFEGENDTRYFTFTPNETGSYGFVGCMGTVELVATLYENDGETILHQGGNQPSNKDIWVANTLLANQSYYIKLQNTLYDYDADKCVFGFDIVKYELPDNAYATVQSHLVNYDYGLDANILPAWQIATGNGVTVAVSDSGIDYNHEDLAANMNILLSYNFTHDMPDIFPNGESMSSPNSAINGHGTHVAGIIAAEHNNVGTVGIAPDASVIGYKTLGTRISGNPSYIASAAASANAIREANGQGVRVMNCSFGGSRASAAEKEAIENAGNLLFVCSAGNRGVDLALQPQYPACFEMENILTVTAVDADGQLASYANYGGTTALTAQGTQIYSTFPENSYIKKDGTSMATPVVTGVVALLLEKNPAYTPAQLKTILTHPDSVTELPGLERKVRTQGMVNAFKALTNTENALFSNNTDQLYLNRDPFSNREVKSVIAEIMQNASDDDKTGGVIIKLDHNVQIHDLLYEIKQNSGLDFELVSEIGIENGFLIDAGSPPNGDALVKLLNERNEVMYAEPNYIRNAE